MLHENNKSLDHQNTNDYKNNYINKNNNNDNNNNLNT